MKHTLKLLAIFLALALLLAGCGSKEAASTPTEAPSATEQTDAVQSSEAEMATEPESDPTESAEADVLPAAPEVTITSFDPALIGRWICVEAVHNGDVQFTEDMLSTLLILPNGILRYDHTDTIGIKVTTHDNTISINDGMLQLAKEQGSYNAEETMDVVYTYEISDLLEPIADTPYAEFFRVNDGDKLTIRGIGTYSSADGTSYKMDSTYVLQKDYPIFYNSHFFEAFMVGNWIDEAGNDWEFTSIPDSTALSYRVKVLDTNEIEEGSVSTDYKEGTERLHFDVGTQISFDIQSYDNNTLTIVYEDGTIKTFTRK